MEKLPKINIIYEDNHLLVVEKPINIPTQKDNSNDIDLLAILKQYRKEKEQKKGNVYLGLVHRLDRPVGGIMVFAKTSKAASRLTKQIQNNEFHKTYYATVLGKVKDKDTYKDYLIKDKRKNITTTTNSKEGKLAILNYELIAYKNNLSLVKINLITGRSHQIRVQFSSRNHPLIGDQKYSNTKKIPIALFAKEISFYHPITKEEVTFKLPLPKRYPFDLF